MTEAVLSVSWLFAFVTLQLQLEMLARLRAGHRDGRRRQADDDFGGRVKTTVLF